MTNTIAPFQQPAFGSIIVNGAMYDEATGRGHLTLQLTGPDYQRFAPLSNGYDVLTITVQPAANARRSLRGYDIAVAGYDKAGGILEPAVYHHPSDWTPKTLASFCYELVTRAKQPGKPFQQEESQDKALLPSNPNRETTLSDSFDYPDFMAIQAMLRSALNAPLKRLGLQSPRPL